MGKQPCEINSSLNVWTIHSESYNRMEVAYSYEDRMTVPFHHIIIIIQSRNYSHKQT